MKKPKSPETGLSESVSILFEVKGFFTSVRTTLFLLFSVAVGAILGTIIPQGESLDRIAISGHPFLYKLAVILDLNNVFRSWWFTALLALLTLNIVGCLLQKIPIILNDWRGKTSKVNFQFHYRSSTASKDLYDTLVNAGRSVMRGDPVKKEADGKLFLSWDKHKIYLLGFPMIHIGIIVILLGSVIGAYWGFKGHVLIREGETTDKFSYTSSNLTGTLPFSITVDDFKLEKYSTGEPREFRSNVRLSQDGKEVLKGSILVNHPLTLEGISLFQSDYRVLGVKDVKLQFKTKDGQVLEKVANPREDIDIPGTDVKLKTRSLDPGTLAQGPGIQVNVVGKSDPPPLFDIYQKDKKPLDVDGVEIRFQGFTPLYATGLQIGYDPGVRIVWLGCSMLIIGFILSLFTNLRRIAVEMTSSVDGTLVLVQGRSRKLRREFRQSVEHEFSKISDLKKLK